jgi:hypothetical protein
MSDKNIPEATPKDGSDCVYKMKACNSPTSVKMPEHLDDTNWGICRQRMTHSLSFYCVEGYLYGIPVRPSDDDESDDLENWEHNDRFVQMVITMNITSSEMAHISRCNTAAAMWSNLRAVHETGGHLTSMIMKRNLFQTRARDGDNITQHLARMKEKWEQICQIGGKRSSANYVCLKKPW